MFIFNIFTLLAISLAWLLVAGQTVNTTSGRFIGHPAPGAAGVTEYLGIPYGRDTSGAQRFAPPVRATYSQDIRTADRNVSCPANPILGPGGVRALPFGSQVNFGQNGAFLYDLLTNTPFTYTEDCLTVNIWTKPQTGEARKAVLLWIYGGAFNLGTTADARYSGQYLADRNDVVVVTFNYRLGIFGFPSAPNTRQNLGFLDQRLAIEWVRDNVAAFGGDPSRITLFGQSAGSIAQDFYAIAYAQDPIVNGFILQSGSALGLPARPANSMNAAWFAAAQRAGCDALGGNDAVLQCMRSLPFQDILTAVSAPAGYPSIAAGIVFWPVVDNIIIFSDTVQRLESGQFANRPVLTGTTDFEFGFITPGATALNGFPPPRGLIELGNQAIFNCPASKRAAALVRNGIRTYRYRWFGYFSNTALGLGRDSSEAYHTSELSTVFGTSGDFGSANTANQDAIQQYLMNVWSTFAKDPENGLSMLGWPIYSNTNPQVVRLAYQNTTGISPVGANTYDVGCGTISLPDIRDFLNETLHASQDQ